MNLNQRYFNQQWGREKIETISSYNTLANPYSHILEKDSYFSTQYRQTKGKDRPQPKVMVNDQMLKSRQDQINNEYGYQDSRFVTEEGKNKASNTFKGIKQGSRFYAAESVTPDQIASDHGPSIFGIHKKKQQQSDVIHMEPTPDIEMKDESQKEQQQPTEEKRLGQGFKQGFF